VAEFVIIFLALSLKYSLFSVALQFYLRGIDLKGRKFFVTEDMFLIKCLGKIFLSSLPSGGGDGVGRIARSSPFQLLTISEPLPLASSYSLLKIQFIENPQRSSYKITKVNPILPSLSGGGTRKLRAGFGCNALAHAFSYMPS